MRVAQILKDRNADTVALYEQLTSLFKKSRHISDGFFMEYAGTFEFKNSDGELEKDTRATIFNLGEEPCAIISFEISGFEKRMYISLSIHCLGAEEHLGSLTEYEISSRNPLYDLPFAGDCKVCHAGLEYGKINEHVLISFIKQTIAEFLTPVFGDDA